MSESTDELGFVTSDQIDEWGFFWDSNVSESGLTSTETITSTSCYSIQRPFQNKTFYANGRYWIFYFSSTGNFAYNSSTNGSSWGTPVTISTDVPNEYAAVYFDGTYVHYTYYKTSYDVIYRRGTPNSDGTISWSASEQTVYNGTSSSYYTVKTISVDINGHAWIGCTKFTDGVEDAGVIFRNANTDGTWANDTGFPYTISSSDQDHTILLVPLSNGSVYAISCKEDSSIYGRLWLYGTGWQSNETVTSSYPESRLYVDATASGNDVMFVYENSSSQVRYVYRTYGSGWGTDTLLSSTGYDGIKVTNSLIGIYCIISDQSNNRFLYSVYSNGSWSSLTNLTSASIYSNTEFTGSMFENSHIIAIAWKTSDSKVGFYYLQTATTVSKDLYGEFYLKNKIYKLSSALQSIKNKVFTLGSYLYNTRSIVYKASDHLYNLKNKVYSLGSLPYNVRNKVGNISNSIYTLRNNVYKLSSSIHTVRNNVQNSIQSLYSILSRVFVLNIFLYSLFNKVSVGSSFLFTILNKVYNSISFSFIVRNIVSALQSSIYSIRNSIYLLNRFSYNLFMKIYNIQSLSYYVRNLVYKLNSFSYLIKNIVQATESLVYSIKNIIYVTISSIHFVLTGLYKSLEFIYNSFQKTVKEIQIIWNIRGLILYLIFDDYEYNQSVYDQIHGIEFRPETYVIDSCESTSSWSGTNVSLSTDRKVGSYSIKEEIISPVSGNVYSLINTNTKEFIWEERRNLSFYLKCNRQSSDFDYARIYLVDSAGYYRYWNLNFNQDEWTLFRKKFTLDERYYLQLPSDEDGASYTIINDCESVNDWSSNLPGMVLEDISVHGSYSIYSYGNITKDSSYYIKYDPSSAIDLSNGRYLSITFCTYEDQSTFNYLRLKIVDTSGNYAYKDLEPEQWLFRNYVIDLENMDYESSPPPDLDSIDYIAIEVSYNTNQYVHLFVDFIRLDDISFLDSVHVEFRFKTKDTNSFYYLIDDVELTSSPILSDEGRVGKSIESNGLDYLLERNSTDPKLDGKESTITCWFKAYSDKTCQKIYGKWRPNLMYLPGLSLVWEMHDQLGWERYESLNYSPISNNKWYFAVQRIIPESSYNQFDGKVDYFLYDENGLVSSGTYSGFGTPVDSDNDTIRIPWINWMGINNSSFLGKIDEFRIYNRALSDQEIEDLWKFPYAYRILSSTYRSFQIIHDIIDSVFTIRNLLYKVTELPYMIRNTLNRIVEGSYSILNKLQLSLIWIYGIFGHISTSISLGIYYILNKISNLVDLPYKLFNKIEVSLNGFYNIIEKIIAKLELGRTSLSFDGVDDYVQVSNSPSLKNFSAMTFLVWIKPPAFNGVNRFLVDVGYWDYPYGYLSYFSDFYNDLYIFLRNTEGTAVSATQIAFTPDVWIQVGWVWDGTTVYSIKNGVLQTGVAFSGLIDPTANIIMGLNFNGLINEVRIYNRALSEDEIKKLYYGYRIKDGLVAEYLFDEQSGNTAYDTSGNGNNGTIYGATWTIEGSYLIKNILAKITDLSYKMFGYVQSSISSLYGVLQNVFLNLGYGNYTIRNLVSAIKDISYNISNIVKSSISSVHNILQKIFANVNGSYFIRNTMYKITEIPYGLFNIVKSSINTAYTLMQRLFVNLEYGTYLIRNLVSKIADVSYNVIRIVQSSITSIYSVLWNVLVNLAYGNYLIKNITSKILDVSYKLFETVKSTVIMLYSSIEKIFANVNWSYIIWNSISKIIDVSYNLINRLYALISGLYGIFEEKIIDSTIVYSIGSIISKIIDQTYTIRNIIGNSIISLYYVLNKVYNISVLGVYSIINLVYSGISFIYSIAGLIVQNISVLYNLIEKILPSISLDYSLRNIISKITDLPYSVLNLIKNDIEIIFNVLNKVFNVTELSYNISNIVKNSVEIVYGLLNKVLQLSELSYSIRNITDKVISFIYIIYEQLPIYKIISTSYSIVEIISAIMDSIYSNLNRVYLSIVKTYNINNLIYQINRFGYSIYNLVVKEVLSIYNLLNKVLNSISVLFNVRNITGIIIDSAYAIRSIIGNIISFLYNIYEGLPVYQIISTTYSIVEWIYAVIDSIHTNLNKAYQSIIKTYNIRESIYLVNRFSYGLFNLVEKELESLFNLLMKVINSIVNVFNIRNVVQTIIEQIYSIRNLVIRSIDQSYFIKELVYFVIELNHNVRNIITYVFTLISRILNKIHLEQSFMYSLRSLILIEIKLIYTVISNIVINVLIITTNVRKNVYSFISLVYDYVTEYFKYIDVFLGLVNKKFMFELTTKIHSLQLIVKKIYLTLKSEEEQ